MSVPKYRDLIRQIWTLLDTKKDIDWVAAELQRMAQDPELLPDWLTQNCSSDALLLIILAPLVGLIVLTRELDHIDKLEFWTVQAFSEGHIPWG